MEADCGWPSSSGREEQQRFCSTTVNELGAVVNRCLISGQFKSALFWAEQRLFLTAKVGESTQLTTSEQRFWNDVQNALVCDETNVKEVICFLRTLCAAGEWDRTISFCDRHRLIDRHFAYAYFYGNALYRLECCEQAIDIIVERLPVVPAQEEESLVVNPQPAANRNMEMESAESADITSGCTTAAEFGTTGESASTSATNQHTNSVKTTEQRLLDEVAYKYKLNSALSLVLGKCYLKQENRTEATNCLKAALTLDPWCMEALDLIMAHDLFTAKELQPLLAQMPVRQSASCLGSVKIIEYLYAMQASTKGAQVPGLVLDRSDNEIACVNLSNSFRTNAALKLYECGDYRAAYKYTCSVMQETGSMYEDCLPTHIAVLVNLRKSSELFTLAHKLIEKCKHWSLSWYVVGCYYYTIGRMGAAKQFFHKATMMDETNGRNWIAFGHVFAKEGENDQAMTCYIRASRLLPGRYEPFVYIGMEHAFANNYHLAKQFLNEAASISSEQPRVLHEQGCLAFCLKKDYIEADRLFRQALRLVYNVGPDTDVMPLLRRQLPDSWEPLLNNLGHVARKLQKYDQAVDFHRKSLVLCPRKASTLSALGVAYISAGKVELGADTLHQSLAIKPDDAVSKYLLKALMDFMDKHPVVWTGRPEFASREEIIFAPEPIVKVPSVPNKHASTASSRTSSAGRRRSGRSRGGGTGSDRKSTDSKQSVVLGRLDLSLMSGQSGSGMMMEMDEDDD